MRGSHRSVILGREDISVSAVGISNEWLHRTPDGGTSPHFSGRTPPRERFGLTNNFIRDKEGIRNNSATNLIFDYYQAKSLVKKFQKKNLYLYIDIPENIIKYKVHIYRVS